MGKFVLADSELENTTGQGPNSFGNNNMGPCFIVQAEDQQKTLLNPTTAPGGIMGMYYSLMFELPKDNWNPAKPEETIEVSPVHQQYYQLVTAQKEQLEGKIKQGMASISQSIADLELVEHDKRKYDEFQEYLVDLKSPDDKRKRAANLRLKSVFVDQVDFHVGGTGQGAGRLSLAFMRNNNIMPTVVDDFFRMKSLESIKTGNLRDLPDVERRMLETKFNAYNQWIEVFRSTVERRLERMDILIKSRKKTLDEYREWLKPIIARHRMIKEVADIKDKRKDYSVHFLNSPGSAVSRNLSTTWVWKNMLIPDDRLYPREMEAMYKLKTFDPWAEKNLVYSYDTGLICKHPWITKEWIDAKAKSIEDKFDSNKIYFTFGTIDLCKTNIKFASGSELEDGDFEVQMFIFSKNAMLVKLLELEAIKEDLEVYISDMLGIKHKFDDVKSVKPKKGTKAKEGEKPPELTLKVPINYRKTGGKYELHPDCLSNLRSKEMSNYFEHVSRSIELYNKLEKEKKSKKDKQLKLSKTEFFKVFPHEQYYPVEYKKTNESFDDLLHLFGIHSLKNALMRKGPYENTFDERVTKFYLKFSSGRFDQILGMIKRRMKIAEIQ